MRESLRLSNYIAKEIQNQHLKENMKFASQRNLSRASKLRGNFSKPLSSRYDFYLYSNVHGNELVFKESDFEIAGFEDAAEIKEVILRIQSEINTQLYGLWVNNREYSKKLAFPWQGGTSRWGLLLIVLIFSLLCLPSLDPQIKEAIVWVMLSCITLTVVASVVGIVVMMCTPYSEIDYDTASIEAILGVLTEHEKALTDLKVQIKCDEVLTWVCFNQGEEGLSVSKFLDESVPSDSESL